MKRGQMSKSLEDRLKKTLLKKRLVGTLAGTLTTATIVLMALLILTALAGMVILPVSVKVTLLVMSLLLALVSFALFAVGRFFSGDVENVAVDLEGKYPTLKGRLIAAIQFARMTRSPGYSKELIQATQHQAVETAGKMDFAAAVSYSPLVRTVRLLAVALVAALIVTATAPRLVSYAWQVYSDPLSVVTPPLGYLLVPHPGSTQWVKYRDIDIGASLFGEDIPEKAVIHHRLAGGSWLETEIDISRQDVHRLKWGDSVAFAVTLRQVDRSFDYFVEAGRVTTEVQKVDVVDRPRVTGIELAIFYPDYTGLEPTVIRENNGSFSAVVGSRCSMKVITNLPVNLAELIFVDSGVLPLNVENGAATGSVVIGKSRAYHIHLVDHLGESNPDPIEYYITAVPDEYPSIEVVRPGFDVNLNDELSLPLKVRIFDDYGFSSLVLKYAVVSQGRQSEENVAVLHYSERIKTEGDIEFDWDLSGMNLFPGDYVVYYFEVADNDVISGPKATRSRPYVARLPSLDEIIAQTEAENARRIAGAESILRTGHDLAQRLKNVARKLQAQNNQLEKADWQHQKELEAVVNQNQEMIQQIEELAESMEKSLEQLTDQALMSREIIEKLSQIQKLFEEVATPEMKEAQRKLLEALNNMDPAELQDALRDFQMSQDELLQRLERTLALLKKMQLEQTMEAMIRKAEEIARRQDDVNQRTEQADKDQLPQISEDEQQLKGALEDLQRQAEQMDDLARQAEMDQSQELSDFKRALQETPAGQTMQNMSDALSQKQQSKAARQGKQAYSELMEMLNKMQQQMMAMKGGESEAFEREMKMALQDANNLSRIQEDLLDDAEDIASQSLMLRDMAAEQQALTDAVSGLEKRINELGKQSPFVAAELRRLLSSATTHMGMAMREFDDKRGRQAVLNQKEAMINLNRASIRLMESLKQQQQSQSGGSCNKNTSMLQGLADQQNQLNQQTQQMLGEGGQGQQRADRETLRRLAGEQGTIKKSLEELNREFAGSRQILGRLDDIAREMNEVEQALSSGDVGPEVTEQQLKIYSRMLEASRSLYRKDFSEERQARTATGQMFHIPPELSREILDDRMNLEDRLQRYLGDSYPPQYEEQIKAYFRALLQIETNLIQENHRNNEIRSPGE